MKFHLWSPNDPLEVNSFGTLEPLKSKKIYVPDVMLLPLLAFDKNRNRLGYGKGYYDRYLSNHYYLMLNFEKLIFLQID